MAGTLHRSENRSIIDRQAFHSFGTPQSSHAAVRNHTSPLVLGPMDTLVHPENDRFFTVPSMAISSSLSIPPEG